MKGGANRKSVAQHVRDGTFRPERHAGAAAAVGGPPKKPPTKPKTLVGEGARLWRAVCESLAGVIGPADGAALLQLCLAHDEVVRCFGAMSQHAPGSEEHGRLARALASVTATFDRLAVRFGVTPLDRERLPAARTPSTVEDIEHLKVLTKYFSASPEGQDAMRRLAELGIAVTPTRPRTKLDEAGPPSWADAARGNPAE